jgi:LPPG:FO 2-phospho-L-lactate transferase
MNPSAFGVAKGYADFLDQFVIDREDERLRHKIESLGIKSVPTSVVMKSRDDKRRLARQILALFEK